MIINIRIRWIDSKYMADERTFSSSLVQERRNSKIVCKLKMLSRG
jgi:hypothetical protein